MGFSFKKVFKKSEGKEAGLFGDDRGQTPERRAASVESAGAVRGSDVPSLPPPPLEGDFASPFNADSSEMLSPFDDVPEPAPPSAGLAANGAGAVAAYAAPELPAFDGALPAPLPEDPAAAPLPTRYDSESAKDLEDKGFRPLSSLPNRGEVPPATQSMELPPTNELPNPDRQPHHADGGLQSPFEVAGSRTTPFAGDPGPQQPQSQPPGGPPSPFEIASDPAPPAPAAAPPAWEQQPAAQPQFQPPAPQTPASPFESEAPAPIPSGPIPTPVETAGPMPGAAPLQHTPVEEDESVHLPPGALEDSREFVEMNVMQLLGGVAPAELGLAELAVSPFAKTRVPMAMLRPQLPTGQVFLNVSDVIVGCKPEHRAELVGCNPTVRLRVPLALIFPMAGEMPAVPAAPPAPAAVAPAPDPFAGSPQTTLPPTDPTPSPFSNGEALPPAGAPAATPNAGVLGGFPVLGSAASAPPAEGTPAIAPQGFPPAAGAVNLEPPQAEVPPPAANVGSSFGSPLAALAPLGGGVEPASPAPAPISDEDQASPLPPLMPAGGGLAPTSFEMPAEAPRQPEPPAAPRDEPAPPAASEAGGWPFDESQNGAPPAVEEVVESLEDLMPVNAEGDFTSAAGFESAPAASGPQSALQGLFLKDGAIDAASVVQHCTELPGIDTCAVIGRDGNTSANSGDFSCDAASVFSSLQQLTGALGVSGDEPITVRAGDGMVSYFSGAGLAIGVKHDSRGFRPGVRERLMLIARELGKLAG